ncbi:ABC-type Mn2+/Zn2+ transport system/ periplasmic component [Synechococcus sp. MEDNS5]|uniref:metal ABC transporter substrate-binding protein n=1 Tax=Synechococcus sp. MEDNS5 TaxID=1442554 RepID=UPI0016484A6B|nr:metal ABC transporter substrate-binding protein [Synechococcus sp. MEDNS5]QNJ05764.1 ABC-type Mn2+/Zn2+ transport system/ periplasmic component [Synechococcus sp. MEDNS5]
MFVPFLPSAPGLLIAAAASAPTVVAADGVLCDITKLLVADQAKVVCLIPAGADPHTLALRPADRSNLSKANLVLLNGYNLTPALNGVKAGGPVVSIGEIAVPKNPLKDPHLWHDPSNAAAIVNTTASKLRPLFQGRQDAAINRRRASMDSVLKALGTWTGAQIRTVPEAQRVLVTGHRGFSFLAKRYGIRELPVIDEYATGGRMRPSSLRAISKALKASGTKVIFPDALPPSKTMRRISRSSGVPLAKQPLFGEGQAPGQSLIQTATGNVCNFVVSQGGQCDKKAADQLQKQWAAIN